MLYLFRSGSFATGGPPTEITSSRAFLVGRRLGGIDDSRRFDANLFLKPNTISSGACFKPGNGVKALHDLAKARVPDVNLGIVLGVDVKAGAPISSKADGVLFMRELIAVFLKGDAFQTAL